jgi:hypothetical protein
MLGKTLAVLALAASCVVTGVQPSLASTENSPWPRTEDGPLVTCANAS